MYVLLPAKTTKDASPLALIRQLNDNLEAVIDGSKAIGNPAMLTDYYTGTAGGLGSQFYHTIYRPECLSNYNLSVNVFIENATGPYPRVYPANDSNPVNNFTFYFDFAYVYITINPLATGIAGGKYSIFVQRIIT